MKIYTRQGDSGSTRLASGVKVDKNSCQIEELGVLDEFNASLGVAIASLKSEGEFDAVDQQIINRAQDNCFYFGAVVAQAKEIVLENIASSFSLEDVNALEQRIDYLTNKLPELTNFILPGGTTSAATVHQTRAVCRRVERVLANSTSLQRQPIIKSYLNRLSDYLFTLARWRNKQQNVPEIIWREQNNMIEYENIITDTNEQ